MNKHLVDLLHNAEKAVIGLSSGNTITYLSKFGNIKILSDPARLEFNLDENRTAIVFLEHIETITF